MKTLPAKALLLILALVLALSCAACSPSAPASSPSPVPEKAPWEQMVDLQEEMKAFLLAHQEEMEALARSMTALETESEDLDYQFNVRQNCLAVFRKDPYWDRLEELLTEHPVLEQGAFLAETQLFWFVYYDSTRGFIDNDVCVFSASQYNADGIPYGEVVLIYCPEEPVEKQWFPLDAAAPNWYFTHWYYE